MKLTLLCVLCLLVLSASHCKQESSSCHHDIIIKNNSGDSVIFALKAPKGNSCNLSQREVISANQETKLGLRYCWEDRLSDGSTQEIYIVDPSQLNAVNVYYPCDSIEIYNKVLRHYVLTLEDLKRDNFTVTYP